MKITPPIKDKIIDEVNHINEEIFKKKGTYYKPRISGKFLYLDYFNGINLEKRCRLSYTGNLESWGYSIFLWSTESYSSDAFFAPGLEKFDGTIKGGMLAGEAAYS